MDRDGGGPERSRPPPLLRIAGQRNRKLERPWTRTRAFRLIKTGYLLVATSLLCHFVKCNNRLDRQPRHIPQPYNQTHDSLIDAFSKPDITASVASHAAEVGILKSKKLSVDARVFYN